MLRVQAASLPEVGRLGNGPHSQQNQVLCHQASVLLMTEHGL